MMRPRPAMTTLALAVALALVGCGGGDSDGAAGGASSSTVPSLPPTALDCKPIAFTPNSEDAASSVRATGLTCAEAEAFVRLAGRRTSAGGPAQVDVEGFRCVRVRSVVDPLPQAFYECTSGAKTVTFTRS